MGKAVIFFCLEITFIVFPAIALIFCAIIKRRLTNKECLYLGISCLIGLVFFMIGLFFMGKHLM